jgi:RNA polymerase sigma-70 factor (ECF subfamily)
MVAVIDDRVAGILVLDPRGDKVAAIHAIAARERLIRVSEQWQRSDHDTPLIASW